MCVNTLIHEGFSNPTIFVRFELGHKNRITISANIWYPTQMSKESFYISYACFDDLSTDKKIQFMFISKTETKTETKGSESTSNEVNEYGKSRSFVLNICAALFGAILYVERIT